MNPRPRIRRPGVLRSARALLALALAWTVLPQVARSQPRPVHPDGPRHFAITGARIVTVSDGVIDKGTIVVNDGLIEAVGSNIKVPAGAWVIDGTGKTVYPGLIDAFTTLGHPYTAPQRAFGGFGGGGGRGGAQVSSADWSWGPEDRPGTKSWISAADDIDAGDARLQRWRDAGFTTVLSTLQPGLVPGQAAILDLGRFDHPRDMVVATPVGMRVNLFDRSYAGYPQSLLGSFAYLKQLYLDADHYGKVWAAYDAGPKGKARPNWDQTLEPIVRQQREGWPVLFPAANRKEIGRAIATSAVMGVKPVVYGAQGAYEAADLLAKAGVPALVDLDWPTAPRNADPQAETSLETLRLRDHAPATPMALQKAGVKFAFYSGSLTNPGDMFAKARESVALGLPKDAAIRAFTMSPAEIFGVSDRLGSIEAGKIANLVVASGDIFDDGTRVEQVIVDGEPFEVPAPSAEVAVQGPGGRAGPGRGGRGRGATSSVPTQVPVSQDKGPYRDDAVTLIKNATIMTASHGTIENGSILIQNGKIAAVGTDVSAPSGAHVVDATGMWVIPGIVDCHSHIAADAINEGAVNVSAMVGIKDVLNPNDPNIYWALAGGVTTVDVLHGSANPIGGGNAVIKLRWGSDAQDLLLAGAPPGIKFALGENVTRDRNPPRYPGTRLGQQDVIRQAFVDAKAYKEKWDQWEAGGKKGVPPRRDLKLEKLKEVLEGKRFVHSHAYRADEMLQLMEVADEMGFKIRTFQHGLEGYKIADEIAAHGTGVSTFSDWWAYKVEAYDAIPYNAALMSERGVLVSVNSDSGEEMRHLNQEAAKTMKWGGVTEEQALREVTLNSAKQLGVDKWVGSIDVGKDADLAVFDGYPLDMLGKVVQTYVDGKLYFDRDLDKVRQEAIVKEKAALMEQVGGSRMEGRNAGDRIAPRAGEEVMR